MLAGDDRVRGEEEDELRGPEERWSWRDERRRVSVKAWEE